IFALVFSLIESKFILPAHLASIRLDRSARNWVATGWSRVQAAAQSALMWSRDIVFKPVLLTAIRHRYAALIMFVAVGLYGLSFISLGKVKMVFFPDVPGQIITVSLEMDARAPFQLTKANMERVQRLGETLAEELRQEHALQESPIRTMFLSISSASSAQLWAELIPVADRPNLATLDIMNVWRDRTGQPEGATELRFTATEDWGGGFQINLLGKDVDQLKAASEYLIEFLTEIEGVHNVRESLAPGRPQLAIRVKPEARHLGFDPVTLASQIGNAFGGAEVDKIRRGSEEVRVLVQNSDTARDTYDDLLDSRVRSKFGVWIPFRSVAEITSGYVPETVYRENGKLVNTVSASVDQSVVSPNDLAWAVNYYFVPDMLDYWPDTELEMAGEVEEFGEIQEGMTRALLLATVLIFVLMAVPLKSYWQPVLILAIIPFGWVGAAIGHMIMGLDLSVLSFFGMLALSGVVINDSIVLVTRYNQGIRDGLAVKEAVISAVIGRYRAIFLTTATTVIGLTPLMMETSEQAQYLIPAAVSLAFGELFSTILMLVFVPLLIVITEDVKTIFRGDLNTSTPAVAR
ncbi:MAG: efflux RND transporter permease subunit, partial [Pseudomonadota bacterium]